MLRDMKTGAKHEVAPGPDRSPSKLIWSADGTTLYAIAEDTGQSRLFAVDVARGTVSPMTGDGYVEDAGVGGGTIVYSRGAFDSPTEIYELRKDGAPRALPTSTARVSPRRRCRISSSSALPAKAKKVDGFVVEPYGYKEGKEISPSPSSSMVPIAGALAGIRQVWAGMGYGRDDQLPRLERIGGLFANIVNHWADRPLEDLQKGSAYALQKYPWLDGERACALGASYGGYLVEWMAGNWAKPWKCLGSLTMACSTSACGRTRLIFRPSRSRR